jgi:hypothetical protein
LAPAREYGATAFGPHPGTKAVLAFTSSLGWLVSPLHKTVEVAPTRSKERLSIARRGASVHLHSEIASASDF